VFTGLEAILVTQIRECRLNAVTGDVALLARMEKHLFGEGLARSLNRFPNRCFFCFLAWFAILSREVRIICSSPSCPHEQGSGKEKFGSREKQGYIKENGRLTAFVSGQGIPESPYGKISPVSHWQ
jgi:hypothetical protein